MNNEKYVARKDVILRLGIHYHTVHAMAKRGDIDTIQVGTRKKYNLEKYIKDNNIASVNVEKENICYCRVSSQKQKEDLDRQILKMHELYPTYRIISDVASGLNFKRKGLDEVIDLAINNKLNSVVIFYKDRLARFGYDLIEMILRKYSNAEIIILNNNENKLPMVEISEDIIAIMNVFVAKTNGMRKYKSNK
jgi:putative resolvase